MYQLGKGFDAGFVGLSADLSAAALTGKRTNARNTRNPNFLTLLGAAASGTESVVFTINQWAASSGGSATPYVADHAWVKSATLLLNSEKWVKVANAATDGTLSLAGATFATKQCLVLIEIDTQSLADGCDYVSLDIGDVGSVARTATVLTVPGALTKQRSPEKLDALLF
jgi:hypothetical protein